MTLLGGLLLAASACAVAPAVVVAGDSALVLRSDRRLQAVSLGGAAPPQALGHAGSLASDGQRVWCLEGGQVSELRRDGSSWVRTDVPGAAGACRGLVPGAPEPLCVTADGVLRPADGARWKVPSVLRFPQLRGLLREGFGFGRVVAAGHGSRVVVATNHGEWGGILWFLDTATGAWSARQVAAEVEGVVWWSAGWLVAGNGIMVERGALWTHDVEGGFLTEGPVYPASLCSLAADASGAAAGVLVAGGPRAVGPSLDLVGVEQPALLRAGSRAYLGEDGWCRKAGALLVLSPESLVVVDGQGRLERFDRFGLHLGR